MVRHIGIFVLIASFLTGYAQDLDFGAGFWLGPGKISSKNLQSNYEFQRDNEEEIQRWEVNNNLGFGYGIRGMVHYRINPSFRIISEPSISFLSNEIDMFYKEDDRNPSGEGKVESIDSETNVSMTYFELPFLAQYQFSVPEGPFVRAGLGFDFHGSPEIEVVGTVTKKVYRDGPGQNLDKEETDAYRVHQSLSEFDAVGVKAIVGGGYTLNVFDRNLWMGLRLNLPLTGSEMYVHSSRFHDDVEKNNEVFSWEGKRDAEEEAPPYLINDFRKWTLSLTITYTIYSMGETSGDE